MVCIEFNIPGSIVLPLRSCDECSEEQGKQSDEERRTSPNEERSDEFEYTYLQVDAEQGEVERREMNFIRSILR